MGGGWHVGKQMGDREEGKRERGYLLPMGTFWVTMECENVFIEPPAHTPDVV